MKQVNVMLVALMLFSSLYAGVLGREDNMFDELDAVAPAAGPTLFEKSSPYSVDETVKRFKAIIAKKGLTHFATIDHQANAQDVGLDMKKAVVIIFGNPKGGTVLMNTDIRMALALPLKVAVVEGRGGVKIVYRNPATYEIDYLVEGLSMIEKIKKGLDNLTNAAIK